MQRTIDAPGQDWLTEEQAVQYLGFSILVFRRWVDHGWISGIRRLSRQSILYHWKGLVIAQWRLELGDLPPETSSDPKRRPHVAENEAQEEDLAENSAKAKRTGRDS